MPIASVPKTPPMPEPKKTGDCDCRACSCLPGGNFGKKLLMTILGVLLVYGIFYLGTLIQNNIKKYSFIGQADRTERVIMISGYGKVTAANDIAMTTIGYSNVNKDVAKAQLDNKKVMDRVAADLKKLGIADKDMQSNYTIYPEYNYTQDKGQTLVGYRVTNQMSVKIRNLSSISNILALAGKYGATEVSGLSFTIDDPENLKAEARDKAVADAEAKAMKLAQSLGVRLSGVVSYNEYESSEAYPMKYYSGIGGAGGAVPLSAPEVVAPGSNDVIMNVNITYGISTP